MRRGADATLYLDYPKEDILVERVDGKYSINFTISFCVAKIGLSKEKINYIKETKYKK
jgi:hypothetical protein